MPSVLDINPVPVVLPFSPKRLDIRLLSSSVESAEWSCSLGVHVTSLSRLSTPHLFVHPGQACCQLRHCCGERGHWGSWYLLWRVPVHFNISELLL